MPCLNVWKLLKMSDNRTRKRRLVVALAKAHPDWSVIQITHKVRELYPDYTSAAVRIALRDAGIKAPPPVGDWRGMENKELLRRYGHG